MIFLQKEIAKYVALLDEGLQKQVLTFTQTLVSLDDQSPLKAVSGKELTERFAGTITIDEANAMKALIDDPIFGCNKIDKDEW